MNTLSEYERGLLTGKYDDLEWLTLTDLIGKTIISAVEGDDYLILGFKDGAALRVNHWKNHNICFYIIPKPKHSLQNT